MKKSYIILVLAVLFSGIAMAQEAQKKFINYQGVARNSGDQLMTNESMTIGIALKTGSATGAAAYAENHSVTTDANGVFSLKIGNGDAISGDYDTISWGEEATYVTVLLNGSEIGTTEMMAVPYALSSGNGAQHADEVPYDNSISGLAASNAQQAIDELVGSGIVDADADPTNEIQDISLVGTDLSISEGSTIDLSPLIPPGGTDNQNAMEVSYDNAISGLAATNTQAALDELATSGLVDTDDQDLSLSGTTLQITDGASVDLSPIIPPGGTDNQNAAEVPFDNTTSGLVATNTQAAIDELATSGLVDTDDQDLSLSGTTLQITDGASVDLSPIIPAGGTDDQNAVEVPYDNAISGLAATDTQTAIDELAAGGLTDTDDQGLILTGDVLTIEDGTGSVNLMDYADVTVQSGLLMGDGALVSGLEGTVDGQVPKWNSSTNLWELGTDETGVGGSSPWEVNEFGLNRSSGVVNLGHVPTDAADSKFFVFSNVPGVRNGIRSYVIHPGFKVGVSASALSRDDENTFGMRSSVTSEANASSWGYRTDMNASGSGTQYGFYARINGGTGAKYGIYTDGEDSNYFSGAVGIGTENPTSELDVVGSIRSSDLSGTGQRNVVADADGNLVIGSAGGGSSLWEENGSSIHYSGGLVGIGTASPNVMHHVHNGTGIAGAGAFGRYSTSSNSNGLLLGMNESDNRAFLLNIEDGPLHIGTDATTRMTVSNNGDVGIGTVTPTAKLDVVGDFNTSGEINRTSTGDANMVPIAYGTVRPNGVLASGSGNAAVTRTGMGNYEVTISGEDYYFTQYTPQLTINGGDPYFISSTSVSGNLIVNIYDTSGARADSHFTFVVYKQ